MNTANFSDDIKGFPGTIGAMFIVSPFLPSMHRGWIRHVVSFFHHLWRDLWCIVSKYCSI